MSGSGSSAIPSATSPEEVDVSSPPVARRQLSAQMKAKRLAAGMTIEQAADALEWSSTKVSNLETGRSKHPAVTDVRLLLDVYGSQDDREREAILDLTRQSRKRGWWSRYDDVLTGAYTALEAGATNLRLWEPQLIPGLFQLPEYAAAVAQATLIRDPDAVERTVEARVQRQQLLDREDAPEVWAIIDVHALQLLAATDAALHHRQVEHLATLAEDRKSVTVQLLDAEAVGLHPGMGGPFAIMDYGDPSATMVFLETDTDGLYLDKKPEVDRYRKIFDRLVSKAMDPDSVPARLRSLIS